MSWRPSGLTGITIDVPFRSCSWTDRGAICERASASVHLSSTKEYGPRAHGLCLQHDFELLVVEFYLERLQEPKLTEMSFVEAEVMEVMES